MSSVRSQTSEGHYVKLQLPLLCLHSTADSSHHQVIEVGYREGWWGEWRGDGEGGGVVGRVEGWWGEWRGGGESGGVVGRVDVVMGRVVG